MTGDEQTKKRHARFRDKRFWLSFASSLGMTLLWIEAVGLSPIFGDLILDRELFWKPHKNLLMGVNADGYRGPRIDSAAPRGGARIACFGDSATFGLGVLNPADAWPGQLQSLLHAKGRPAQIMNFGAPGYTIVQGMRLLQDVASVYRLDAAIFRFGHNEGKSSRTFLADSNRRFVSAPMLGGLLPRWSRTARLCQFLRARWAAIRPTGGRSSMRVPPEEYETTATNVSAFCRERGIAPIFVEYPEMDADEERMMYEKITRDVCIKTETRWIATPALIRTGRPAFLRDGSHPSRLGHRLIAEALQQI